MRLWTIQPLVVWEQVQQNGVCYVEVDYVPETYHWLVARLKDRIPGYSGRLPWWAYCQKPDLRTFRHTHCSGTIHVRLELELPEQEVFCMPYWAWDKVYCGDYLTFHKEEYDAWHASWQCAYSEDAFYDSWPRPEPWHTQLEASWERLFSPELPLHDIHQEPAESARIYTEAVFEPLHLETVRRVTRFVGASRYRSA